MNIGIIFAGGTGSRMHSKDKPKQFLEIFGKPVIIHTLEKFEECQDIDAIVISCLSDWIPHMTELAEKYHITKVRKIVSGDSTGQLSIFRGLEAAEEIADENAVVLIHDGVRPFITGKLLSENIRCVMKHGSAITTGKVTETIITVDELSRITTVPRRKDSRVAKAPQSFFLKDIIGVHRKAMAEGFTNFIDSCTMMNYYGHDLFLTDGPSQNIKITTPEDFYLMRAIMESRENEQLYGIDSQEDTL